MDDDDVSLIPKAFIREAIVDVESKPRFVIGDGKPTEELEGEDSGSWSRRLLGVRSIAVGDTTVEEDEAEKAGNGAKGVFVVDDEPKAV